MKEKSILVKVDFSKQDDIDKFFGDDEFPIDYNEVEIIPIAKQYNLSKVYLFGSYARGEEDENSDIDIALELKDVSKYMAIWRVKC